MTRTPRLDAAVAAKVARIGSADLVVGIPSFNNERTIGHVVRAVVSGIAKHFPQARAVLVNCDGGSTDRTREIVERTEVGDVLEILADAAPASWATRIVTPYEGIPGKGSALRTIFRVAADLDARACCVVDSDLRSITPDWIELLVEPVLRHGFEFVAPLYARHRYDGTITNTIVRPLTQALYGRRIRQPIGGDFGFSGPLAARFLEFEGWDGPVARYGIDIFMTTTAVAEGRRVCQAFLGAKIHDPKDPGADLQPMLVQVVSTLFDLMQRYEDAWEGVRGSESVPVFGFPYAVGLEPVSVDATRLAHLFREGARELPPIWDAFLSAATLCAIEEAAKTRDPSLGDDLWVSVLFEFAAAWRSRVMPPGALIGSLVPLYLGKVATFVAESQDATNDEAERRLDALATRFEERKDELRALWRDGRLERS